MSILSDIMSDVGAEVGRLGVQGQMEMASAIFSGNTFVPYGPGQYTPSAENTVAAPEVPQIEEPSRGMEM